MTHNQIAILTDVDMTLVPSTSKVLSDERRAIALALHQKLGGAFALVTGRPQSSVDETFNGFLPASVEHHSAWRPTQGSQFNALAPHLDSDALHASAHKMIHGNLHIFDEQHEVLGDKAGVFIELKKHSLALIFAPKATPEAGKDLLKSVAAKMLVGPLATSHRISVGSDAVEIVPNGLNKGDAVRHFMSTPAFAGKTPIFIGDSSSDEKGMIVCANEYGGHGIAVGGGIPDAPHIKTRLQNPDQVWAYLQSLTL